jgi:hypothetical protein
LVKIAGCYLQAGVLASPNRQGISVFSLKAVHQILAKAVSVWIFFLNFSWKSCIGMDHKRIEGGADGKRKSFL